MDNQHFFKIQEKSETKFINMGQVSYVVIQDPNITFHLMTGKSLLFTKPALGEEEFERIKNSFLPQPYIKAL
jgi:DNA-binding LytR/AlgR family response regulator